jgi:hypothetical protein
MSMTMHSGHVRLDVAPLFLPCYAPIYPAVAPFSQPSVTSFELALHMWLHYCHL